MKTSPRDRSRLRRLALRTLPFAVLAAVAMPVLADDEGSGATYGRVRYVDGPLTIEQLSEGEVVEGIVNSPIVAGDRAITTGGRAEIELADSSIVWMDGDTRLEFKSLADVQNRYERTNLLALIQGSIRVEVSDPGDPDAVFQIDTGDGSVYLLSAGSFRIDAVGGSTTVSSQGGVAEFSGDGGSVLIRSGQRSSVQSGRNPSNPRRFNTQRQDDFDRFCSDRSDAFLRQGEGERYDEDLPEEVRPYASELSFYGTWHSIPTYGIVWRPHYAGVWSPYHHGYWSGCRGSWVWVSYDPWGWAPYHYGRWDYAGDLGWFWVPGAVWSGGWVSFAVGPSYIGWCPLNYWNVPVFHDVWIVDRTTVNVGRLDPRGWHFVPAGRFGVRGPDTAVVRGDRLPRNSELVVTQRLPQFDPRVIAKQPERAASVVDTARRTRVAPPISQEPGGMLTSFRAIERRSPRGATGHATVARPTPRRVPDTAPSAGTLSGRPPGSRPRTPSPTVSGATATRVPPSTPSTSTPSRPSRVGATDQRTGPRGGGETPRDADAKDKQAAPSQAQPPREPDRERGRAMERLLEGARSKTPEGSAAPPPQRVSPPRTTDPPRASDAQRPAPPPRTATPPRRTPEKKPPAHEPPPRDDSPESRRQDR